MSDEKFYESELKKMERKLSAREWLIRFLGGGTSSPEPAWDAMREAVEDLQQRAAAFNWLEKRLNDHGYTYAKGFADPEIDTLCLSLWIDCNQPTLLEAIKAEMERES